MRKFINNLPVWLLILSTLIALGSLPVWVVLLVMDKWSLLGWAIMVITLVPQFIIMAYRDIRNI